nr:D-alanine--D-alanine ligase [Calderihabitans maritimus]
MAVLLGGLSAEREVSLKTGEAVYEALKSKGYNAVKVDVDRQVVEKLKKINPDVAFIALHGKFGEDGTVQGVLEMLGIPYTGSGVLASAVAMNKIATKKILCFEKIPTPPFMVVDSIMREKLDEKTLQKQIISKINLPLVIKAPSQGSTIGVYFVKKEEELLPSLKEAFRFDEEILIERFIEGTEVTASVLGNKDLIALPLIEIVSHTGVYDYEAKYTPGLSEHIIPARIPPETDLAVKNLALKTYRTIGCRGLARVDFIIDRQGKPYVLEVNTIPGMTATSLFPDAARAAGIEFPDLIHKLVELALEEKN